MSKNTSKKNSVSKAPTSASAVEVEEKVMSPNKRKRLLARVAGDLASGMIQAPSPAMTTASKIADISVDLAEEILQKVGL